MSEQSDHEAETFETLLRYLRDARGFDFTGYKRASLMRRVRHRMEQAGYATFEEYLDALQASADEFAALFNTILINVTSFFRTRTPGTTFATRWCPRCWRNGALVIRSECGAQAARRDRRPTPWR